MLLLLFMLGAQHHRCAAKMVRAPLLAQVEDTPQEATARSAPAWIELGATVYERHCANCHGSNGEGVVGIYPGLAGNRAVGSEQDARPQAVIVLVGARLGLTHKHTATRTVRSVIRVAMGGGPVTTPVFCRAGAGRTRRGCRAKRHAYCRSSFFSV